MSEANGSKDEEREQRDKDLKELGESYHAGYPKMGNYSKKEVRKSQGEAPKVKFRPIDKTVSKPVSLNKYLENGHQESKHVPLNMLMKASEKMKPNGIEEVFYQHFGTSGIYSRAEAFEDNLAMDGEVPSY